MPESVPRIPEWIADITSGHTGSDVSALPVMSLCLQCWSPSLVSLPTSCQGLATVRAKEHVFLQGQIAKPPEGQNPVNTVKNSK